MSLTQVYCSAEQPKVDIVFVHEVDTWTSGSFWLSGLVSEILTPVRGLTYGYSASHDTFTDTLYTQAEHLASALAENRKITDCLGRPIIFVGHSLGSLLVKTLLLHCRTLRDQSEYTDDIYSSTYGIVLLGKPYNTTGSKGWGSIVQNISHAVLGKDTQDAGPSIQDLQNIFESFEVMGDFKISLEETLPTHGAITVLEKSPATPFTRTKHNKASDPGLSKFIKDEAEHSAIVSILGELSSRAGKDDLQKPAGKKLIHLLSTHTIAMRLTEVSLADTLTTRSSTPGEPLFVVPTDLHPNATFYGKRADFDRLHSTLTSPSDGIRPRSVLICGPPGSGKTYLARQYIWTHRASYPGGIFWVNAGSLQSLTSGLDKVALALANTRSNHTVLKEAHLPSQTVHDHLSARTGWLVVFDGLDPPDNDRAIDYLGGVLPANRDGSILYTSVDDSLASKRQLHCPEILRVSPLPVEEACRLLFTKLGIRKPLEMQVRKATLIAMRYEGLPLAIHAVCNYLSRTAKPIERFRIDTRLADSMLTGPFFKALDKLYSERQFGVLNLVNILCFFDAPMKVDFLHVGARAVEKYDIRICDNEDLHASFKTMIRYGLVQDASGDTPEASGSGESSHTELSDEGTLSAIKMHGVARFVCRDRLRATEYDSREDQYHAWLLAAFEILSASYEGMRAALSTAGEASTESGIARYTKDCGDYLLHVQSLAKHFPRKGSVSTAISEGFDRLKRMNKSILDDLSRLGATQGDASSHTFSVDIESDQSLATPSRSQNESHSQASDDLPSDAEWGIVNPSSPREEHQHPSRWNEIRDWAKQTAVRTMETPLLTRFVPKSRPAESPYSHSDALNGYIIRNRTRSDDSPFRAEGSSLVRPSIRSMTHPSVFLPGELPSVGYRRRTERQSPGPTYFDGAGLRDLAGSRPVDVQQTDSSKADL